MFEYLAPYAAGYLGALALLVAVVAGWQWARERRARRHATDWTVSGRTLDLLHRRQEVRRG